MSFWFLLWLFLSLTLFYFFGWTLVILFKQQRTWAAFAKKHGLRFVQNTFFETPRLDGVIRGYTVALFSAEHTKEDQRRSRKLTVFEVQIPSEMPFGGAVASGDMIDVMRTVGFNAQIDLKEYKLNPSCSVFTDQPHAMRHYLTPERIKALNAISRLSNAWVTLAFRNEIFVLRLDTPHALEVPKKLSDLVSLLIRSASVFDLKDAELMELKAKIAADAIEGRKQRDQASLSESQSGNGVADIVLELEDDEAGDLNDRSDNDAEESDIDQVETKEVLEQDPEEKA